jgi:DNA-binding MarR family transcriptional regulator
VTRTEGRNELRRALAELFAAQRRLRGRDALQKTGITHAQMHLLRVLTEQDEELSASRLAASADLTATSVTQMVDGLESQGLVGRVRSAADRRVVFIRLTPAGREAVEEHLAVYDQRTKELLSDMSADELVNAAAVLRRIASMLDGL